MKFALGQYHRVTDHFASRFLNTPSLWEGSPFVLVHVWQLCFCCCCVTHRNIPVSALGLLKSLEKAGTDGVLAKVIFIRTCRG